MLTTGTVRDGMTSRRGIILGYRLHASATGYWLLATGYTGYRLQ
jgi:hypothetical protein